VITRAKFEEGRNGAGIKGNGGSTDDTGINQSILKIRVAGK
jgi:hypothetical protein